jgi:hypothetical protein
MATKKKLLQAAAGSAGGGAGALNVEDVFSTYLYDGNGESQSIDNGINLGQSNDGGSAHFEPDDSNDTDGIALGSANYITSGDFTIECFVWIEGLNSTNTNGYEIPTIFYFNSPRLSLTYDFVSPGGSADQAFNLFDTTYRFGSINQHPEATYTNTWVHVAVVRNSGTIRCYVDGTEAFNFSNTTDYSGATLTIGNNSNGTPVQGHISNFRVVDGTAVYTSSFTPPTSELTAISGTTLLTFTSENTLTDTSSSSHAFTVTGSVSASNFGPFDAADAGEGGLVWIKRRSGIDTHQLYDTERGAGNILVSSNTNAETNYPTGFTSFNASGFSMGPQYGTNTSGHTYASWTFRKAPKFFDVVTYTGNGANRTIAHNLGSVPGCIIVKRTDGSNPWAVYHRGSSPTVPEDKQLQLNATDGAVNGFTTWNRTLPTDTVFSVGTEGKVNESGWQYVAYLFAHNDGDGDFGSTADQDIIKCGSYTGNGSTDGPEIDLGFEPQWLLYKNASTGGTGWVIVDNMRGITTGGDDALLQAQSSGAELSSGYNYNDLQANGFKVTTTADGANTNGDTYIYIAIRRGPMAVPTDATDVFAIDELSSAAYYSGFTVDMAIERDTGFHPTRNSARLIGEQYLDMNNANTATGATTYAWDNNTGWFDYQAAANRFSWMWARAPQFMDCVSYTGTGSLRTVNHNLGVVPEMMIFKNLDTTGTNWDTYHKDLGANGFVSINLSSAYIANTNRFNGTTPTDTQFTVNTAARVNEAGSQLVAYLFATLDGISKVGSYTGNGTSQNIDCGFSNGARFVLIKRTDATGDWNFYDTERGIVSGNDSRLVLNQQDGADGSSDRIDPYSAGFTINYVATGNSDSNISGATYIFYAIA